ncbi:MAG: chromate transporter [Acidobacteria bacterium]|nr:MAG: chromate transporter [Acidobacteriota bacterium]
MPRGAEPSKTSPGREHGQGLSELAWLFLRLGATAFGGPAAHIAIMEHEVVRRRGWLTSGQFLDLLGATNLIPGPNSTEMAIYIGHARAGWPGLLVAGAAFIVPSTLIVGAIAWAYVRYGSLPATTGLLYGVKPVVIAIVVQALWRLGTQALRSVELLVVTMAAVVALVAGVHELVVLAGAGIVMALVRLASTATRKAATLWALGAGGSLAAGSSPLAAFAAAANGASYGLWPMFLVFLKIGSVLFGSGYVLLAFLRADLVQRLGWLTEQQLLDATAVGQVTPGPVFTTATFVGYLLGGFTGAGVATLGIFLPAFVFVALSGPLVPRLRRSPVAGAVLDGVNAASLAFMAVVVWQLGRTALVDPIAVVLAGVALITLIGSRLSSAWLLAAGGAIGWVVRAR